MTEQEKCKKELETMLKELEIWFNNEPSWLSSEAKATELVIRLGYRRLEKGDIIVHKDSSKRTVEELAFFINHNEKVRKEKAKEIYKAVLDLRELMINNDDSLCILRNVESCAKEDGVEVEE